MTDEHKARVEASKARVAETMRLAKDFRRRRATESKNGVVDRIDVDSVLQHFGDGALDKIEKMLGCASPNESVRVEIAIIAWSYATQRSNLAPAKDLKAWFDNLQESLAAVRSALNPPSNGDVADRIEVILTDHNVHAQIDRLRDGIAAMLEKTAKISCGLVVAPSKGGRPPQTELKVMVIRCAELFRQYCRFPVVNSDVYVRPGRRPDDNSRVNNSYGGRFFDLVEAVDAAAARLSQRRPASDASLGEVIKRTLKEITARKAKPDRT
jgi:hypothetical protein